MSSVLAIANHFGYKAEYSDGKWRYADTKEPFAPGPSDRKCPKCAAHVTEDGADPCIANLPGVVAACCGHGFDDETLGKGYILFSDGTCIRFTGFEVERPNVEGERGRACATSARPQCSTAREDK
jgi:hypothetical protein